MRIGIIGAGAMGQRHAAAWQKAGGRVSGVTSRTPARAEQLACHLGAQTFATLADMLPQVDVVDICTPTESHAALIRQAAEAGRQVVCEKPVALSLEDGFSAVRACREQGVRLYIGHVLRYFPEYVRARQLALSGELGQPGVLRLSRGGYRFRSDRETWFQDESRSGGIALDLMIHDLDYARWVAGEVQCVYARHIPAQVSGGRYDYAIAILTHRCGVLSQVVGAWIYNPPNFRTSFEIACQRGLIQHNSDSESAPGVGDGSRRKRA